MFEKFEVPAFFLAKDAVLNCYTCGRTSGVVVDCGDSGTTVTPVNDGWCETRAIMRSPIGGRFMDFHMLAILRRKTGLKDLIPSYKARRMRDKLYTYTGGDVSAADPSFDLFAQLELARDCKETVCKVAESTFDEQDPRYASIPLLPYELPGKLEIDTLSCHICA